ncbi:MAG: hypothetical protein ACUVXB_03145 [Bryobacteraceae bacterium]
MLEPSGGDAEGKTTPPVRLPVVLARAPEELTKTRLVRLGEGLGRVVYASEHWVVKRERSQTAIFALILIWKVLSRVAHYLPGRMGDFLLRRPSRAIRLLRVLVQGFVSFVPRSIWLMTHTGELWRRHAYLDLRGRQLAQAYLASQALVPERIVFPPVRVKVGGWPGWLVVSEATERVECTLYQRLADLAASGNFDEFELWLERLLEFRQAAWRQGVFSVDAHLKNYGVIGARIVLLDPGGLTDHWPEVANHLAGSTSQDEPHRHLGLASLLKDHPEIAARFDTRWREVVTPEIVLRHWPEPHGSLEEIGPTP